MVTALFLISHLHYRYNWPLFEPELLQLIPNEWKLDKCYALYDPIWSWTNAQHNSILRLKVASLIIVLIEASIY